MSGRGAIAASMLALGLACGGSGGEQGDGNATTPFDPTATSTATTAATDGTTDATGSSTTGVETCSESTPECFCAGEHVTGATEGPPAGYLCMDACVETEDPSLWCKDAAACCDAAAVCEESGICRVPGASTGAGSSTGESSSGTGSSDGGGSSSESSGSSSTG